MNTSGEAMVSQPAEWCSPIQASSKPSSSIHSISSMSRAMARVGFSPTRWNGARKMPNSAPCDCRSVPCETSVGLDRSMGPTLTEAMACADHRAMTEAAPLPLARFTLVELNDDGVPLCLRLATSLAGKIAADLGADVLKIEPPGGDPVRRAPPLLPQRRKRALPVPQHLQALAGARPRRPTAAHQPRARCSTRPMPCLFEEPASVAPLLRAGQRDADRDRGASRSRWTPQRGR